MRSDDDCDISAAGKYDRLRAFCGDARMTETIEYYDRNADDYIRSTRDIDFHAVQDRFLLAVAAAFPDRPEKTIRLLDFGCGSGRDSDYFLRRGFSVSALDGSEVFCRRASELTGIPVRRQLFEEFSDENAFEGIWCCASLLHVRRDALPNVLRALERALTAGGVLYVSFKYGEEEREKDGRHFTDLTEEGLEELIRDIPGLRAEETWISGDARPERGHERWLNSILRRERSAVPDIREEPHRAD